MKISIGHYVLAEGARESDEEPTTTMACAAQIAQRLRGAHAEVFSRGNRVYSFTFTKTRLHENFQAAEAFRLLHPVEIPATGLLTFTTEGEGEANIYFTSHNVDEVTVRQVGVATISTYRITAAGPTTTRPND